MVAAIYRQGESAAEFMWPDAECAMRNAECRIMMNILRNVNDVASSIVLV